MQRHKYIEIELQLNFLIIWKSFVFQMAEYNKWTSKENDFIIRESNDTAVPDSLKPFYMKAT